MNINTEEKSSPLSVWNLSHVGNENNTIETQYEEIESEKSGSPEESVSLLYANVPGGNVVINDSFGVDVRNRRGKISHPNIFVIGEGESSMTSDEEVFYDLNNNMEEVQPLSENECSEEETDLLSSEENHPNVKFPKMIKSKINKLLNKGQEKHLSFLLSNEFRRISSDTDSIISKFSKENEEHSLNKRVKSIIGEKYFHKSKENLEVNRSSSPTRRGTQGGKWFGEERSGSMPELAQIFTASKQRVKQSSKTHLFDSILSVILKDGKNFRPADHGGLRDPFVRFKLAGDKYKSKLCKQTLNPSWREQFDMKIVMSSEDLPPLEITVWDKESGKEEFMGRTSCDLRELQPEKSHYLELDLVDQPGVISLYVALTAQNAIGCVSDLTRHEDDEEYLSDIKNEFSLFQTFGSLKKIGWLQIKLHSASGLAVADLGGASDPFAVIELGNQRLVTQTIYKNLNPRWEKIYDLAVYDIHDVIDITVFDEDKRGAPEFLGRIKIPLLSITSCEKCFYQLKDKRLQGPAKGYLALTFNLEYNPVRASVRTFRPREERILDEPPRFRRQLLQHNVDRLTNLIRSIIATGEFIQSLFTWKYKSRSLFAFLIYVLLVMNFDWFMLPLILFLVLLKNYTIHMLSPTRNQEEDLASQVDDDDDDEDDDKKKGKGKSFREKLEAINNICRLVQNHMDKVASLGERVKNTFNWSVPFLSYLLMVILLLGTILLYLVPLRYLLLAWGINKFTKRIRKPNAIPNNELLDFLSRVPSDPEVKQYRSIKIDST